MKNDYSKHWKDQSNKYWDKYTEDVFDNYNDIQDKWKDTYSSYQKYIKDVNNFYPPSPSVDGAPPASKQRLVKFIIIPLGTTVYAIPRNMEFTIGGANIVTYKKTVNTNIKVERPSAITSQGYYYIKLDTPDWIGYLVSCEHVVGTEEMVDE